jgi:uncharacterized membrane protein
MKQKRKKPNTKQKRKITFGQKVADKFAAAVGSWTFIIIQSMILVLWITLNIMLLYNSWDPYPFILLNLFLSFQAAYTGPMVMMSQNRQSSIDRETMIKDYQLSEESARLLEQIVISLKASQQDRKNQIKLLSKILDEMEEDEDDNAQDARSEAQSKHCTGTTYKEYPGESEMPRTTDRDHGEKNSEESQT